MRPGLEVAARFDVEVEAAFKAFARALRAAVALDSSESGVPSTKGTLT